MKKLYKFETRVGSFYIWQGSDGFHPSLEDGKWLGHYETPQQAIYALANGETFWPDDIDPSTAGLSEDVDDWELLA